MEATVETVEKRLTMLLRGSIVTVGVILAGALLLSVLPATMGQALSTFVEAQNSSAAHKPVAALSPYIDVHTHLDETDVDGSMQSAIDSMPVENLAKIVFMPSPFTLADANRFDVERLRPAAKKYPGKIAVLGGGGTLNPMIIEAARTGDAGPGIQKTIPRTRRSHSRRRRRGIRRDGCGALPLVHTV